ncbi:Arl8a protein [Melanogaster broomeanus]|nr:Arl8a protein [Melanogaster broomeanus]
MSFFSSVLLWFSSVFFAKAAEISVVGLQVSNSGCSEPCTNPCDESQWSEDVVPTVAFNYRKVRKGAVTLKIWDVAGQPKFRSMWERYCNGVDAVVFVVDSADHEKFHTAPSLTGVPLLVIGNKNDVPNHASVKDLIRELELDKIQNRPVSVGSLLISMSQRDIVLRWLAERSH